MSAMHRHGIVQRIITRHSLQVDFISATQKDCDKRLEFKKYIARTLYKANFASQTIRELFRFLDWIMTLPDESPNQSQSTKPQNPAEKPQVTVRADTLHSFSDLSREATAKVLILQACC